MSIKASLPRTFAPQREILLVALLIASTTATGHTAAAADRRGGVELGSKGLKAVVVEIGERPGDTTVRAIMNQVVNTTLSAGVAATRRYDAEAIRETAEAAGKVVARMRDEFNVPPDKIRVFGSSGLPDAENREALVDAIRTATSLPPMEFITPTREVELTIAGLVPREELANVLLLDVGSGNTKGGCVVPGGSVTTFNVPQGSVTFADRVAKAGPSKPFSEAAGELRPSLLEVPLSIQIQAHPELTSRPVAYLNGGAAYALATLMHPEASLQDRVAITAEDIAAYRRKLAAEPGVPAPDYSAVTDPAVRTAAEAEAAKIRDIFTHENLLAGAEILSTFSTVIPFEGKRVVFDRTGVTALVRGITMPEMATPPATKIEDPVSQGPGPNSDHRDRPVYPSPQSPAPTQAPTPVAVRR